MAEQTLDDTYTFTPWTQLGRRGYVPAKSDQLSRKIEQLDALLAVMASGEDEGFQGCTSEIQLTVLHLASDLAAEVHDLHTEVSVEEMCADAARRKNGQAAGEQAGAAP